MRTDVVDVSECTPQNGRTWVVVDSRQGNTFHSWRSVHLPGTISIQLQHAHVRLFLGIKGRERSVAGAVVDERVLVFFFVKIRVVIVVHVVQCISVAARNTVRRHCAHLH